MKALPAFDVVWSLLGWHWNNKDF